MTLQELTVLRLPGFQRSLLRHEGLVALAVAVLLNLADHQLDAGNPSKEGGKAGRPVPVALFPDAFRLRQEGGLEPAPCVRLALLHLTFGLAVTLAHVRPLGLKLPAALL